MFGYNAPVMIRLLIVVAAGSAFAAGCVAPWDREPTEPAKKAAADKSKKSADDDGGPTPWKATRTKEKPKTTEPADDNPVRAAPPIKFDLNRAMKALAVRHEQIGTLMAENDATKALTALDQMETALVQAQFQSGRGEKFGRFAGDAAREVGAVSTLVRQSKWDEAQKRYEHVHSACAACHGVFRKE